MIKLKQNLLVLLLLSSSLLAQEDESLPQAGIQTVHFNDVPMSEFIKFVSKVCNINFVFDEKELGFNVTLTSAKSLDDEALVRSLKQMLHVRGFTTSEEEGSYLIYRRAEKSEDPDKKPTIAFPLLSRGSSNEDFLVYKLQSFQHSGIRSLEFT